MDVVNYSKKFIVDKSAMIIAKYVTVIDIQVY